MFPLRLRTSFVTARYAGMTPDWMGLRQYLKRAELALRLGKSFFTACVVSGLLAVGVCSAQETAGVPAASPIPFKTDSAVTESYGWRVAGGVGVLILLAGAAWYLSKRRSLGVERWSRLFALPAARIRVLERKTLAYRCRLYLIAVDGQELLLSQSGDRIMQLDFSKNAVLNVVDAKAKDA